MRAVVTGGAGFIGSHVVDHLHNNGYEVLIVDDMSSGRAQNIHPNAAFYKGCITTPDAAAQIQSFAPHYLFHLAAQMETLWRA